MDPTKLQLAQGDVKKGEVIKRQLNMATSRLVASQLINTNKKRPRQKVSQPLCVLVIERDGERDSE